MSSIKKTINTIMKIIIKNLFKLKGDKTYNIGDIQLTVDFSDLGGRQYNSKNSFEELVNPLYLEIKNRYDPTYVFDIGANYGFTGILFNKRFPNAHLILIEPSKQLQKYIKYNFDRNNIGASIYDIVGAICSHQHGNLSSFAINPFSSQDNRVKGENSLWKSGEVQTVSVDGIIKQYNIKKSNSFIFFKIDTQGYEENILLGAEEFLTSSNNWIMKIEFAPYWLKSQGTEPIKFLKYLISKYQVAELPNRSRFKGDFLSDIFNSTIEIDEINDFINYIQSLNRDGLGWCDLLISPKINS